MLKNDSGAQAGAIALVLAYMGSVSGEAYITKSIETRFSIYRDVEIYHETVDRKRVPVFEFLQPQMRMENFPSSSPRDYLAFDVHLVEFILKIAFAQGII